MFSDKENFEIYILILLVIQVDMLMMLSVIKQIISLPRSFYEWRMSVWDYWKNYF